MGCKPTNAPCPPSRKANQMIKNQKIKNAPIDGNPSISLASLRLPVFSVSVEFVFVAVVVVVVGAVNVVCCVNIAPITRTTQKMSSAVE